MPKGIRSRCRVRATKARACVDLMPLGKLRRETRNKAKEARATSREFMTAQDRRTTDADEITRRRARASEATFGIENLDSRHPVLSNFKVRSDSGRAYQVEVRGTASGEVSCTCVD